MGEWKLGKIICYHKQQTDTELERYDFTGTADITLGFDADRVNYTVSSTPCTTTASGNYGTDFEGDFKDTLDILNVASGGSCELTITDTGPNTVGNTTIKMAMLGTDSTNLVWSVGGDKKTLILDFFTSFVGSAAAGGCNSNCICEGSYTKD